MNDDTRPFPIQAEVPYRGSGGQMIYAKESHIPWWLAEIAYEYYSSRYGNQQSLERLSERGGFGRFELVEFIRKDRGGETEQQE